MKSTTYEVVDSDGKTHRFVNKRKALTWSCGWGSIPLRIALDEFDAATKGGG